MIVTRMPIFTSLLRGPLPYKVSINTKALRNGVAKDTAICRSKNCKALENAKFVDVIIKEIIHRRI